MEYVEGDGLQNVLGGLTDEQQLKIVSQLRRYLAELRSLKGHFIGSADRSACYDPIFCEGSEDFGPYKSEAAFNEGLIKAMRVAQENTWVDQIANFVKAMHQHNIVFTHGDLSPRNILIRGIGSWRFWIGKWQLGIYQGTVLP